MKKALIIYGSELGNTARLADMIAGTLRSAGLEVEVRNVRDADVRNLLGSQDLTLLGSSTWGAVDAELQSDFIPFFEAMDTVDLAGRTVAVFGVGEHGWSAFAKAVDALRRKVLERGATLAAEGLKVDGDPAGSADAVKAWALEVAGRAR